MEEARKAKGFAQAPSLGLGLGLAHALKRLT